MKKIGLFFSTLLSIFAVSFGHAQEAGSSSVVAQPNSGLPAQSVQADFSGSHQDQNWGEFQGDHQGGEFQGGHHGWDQSSYEGAGYEGGYENRGEHACGEPIQSACGDCYCLYCRYEPCYYNKWNCRYVPQYTCKKNCRQVAQYYEKQNCRYVPQYYTTTCCRYVPQYYYTRTCHYVPKYECQKCCKYVPKYFYKKLPRPAPVCEPAPACDPCGSYSAPAYSSGCSTGGCAR